MNKGSGYLFPVLVSLLLTAAGTMEVFSQMVIRHPVEILNGINTGTILATVNPAFTQNSITNVFDGNNFTMAGAQNTNDLTITLAFSDTVSFTQSTVYFWSNGDWSLEIANSESDLNSGIGSYQLLINQRPHFAFTEDSLQFGNQKALYIRFRAHNSQENYIYLGEWQLMGSITLTRLYIYPRPVKVIPGTTLQLKVKALDENNNLYDYPSSEPPGWYTGNSLVASVGESGDLTGVALGNTTVNAVLTSGGISDQTPVSVVTDFESENASPKTVRVALVLQDPVIDSVHSRRIHQLWSWTNPLILISSLLEEFSNMSHGVINYQIVETIDDDQIFTMMDSVFMSISTLTFYFTPANNMLYGHTAGKLQFIAEDQNRIRFNYNAMVDYYDFDTKRNNGQIDEIWVYSFPFGGMYESQMMGPGAFWLNSPPLAHSGLTRLLPVMGWNYERGVAEALESYGHRSESTMSYVYGGWNVLPVPTPWDIFTWIDKDHPEQAHIGSIHFPPNGLSDYDFGNTNYVITYADNWKRYPLLLNQSRIINCTEWGCSHLGYMRWWFTHLPHFQGSFEGILNNWWHYIVDYDEAVALANSTPWVAIEDEVKSGLPRDYRLNQNYPNPFNPTTSFSFYLPVAENVIFKIYDILGREVDTLLNKKLTAGEHQLQYDASRLATGLYFYQLSTDHFSQTRKMLLLK